MEFIYIVGAGGFGKEVAWLIERVNDSKKQYEICGYIDDGKEIGYQNGKYKVIGTTEDLLKMEGNVVVAIGNAQVRKKIVDKLKKNKNLKFPNVVDPSAITNKEAILGEGNIICAGNILTVDYTLGNFNILNLDCTVGHDAILKDYVTCYPSVNISGNTKIDALCEIGTGTQILQGIHIGQDVIVGAGSVITKDMEDHCTVVGVPGKVIKRREG